MQRNLGLLALLVVGQAWVGCGGDNGGGGGVTESPNLGEKTEKKITAASGGEVALAEAGVTLTIPAGALASDETITAEVVSKKDLSEAEQLAGNVVEFGPDGLTFEMPVTLELDVAGADIPKDAEVAIAWYDEKTKKWNDLAGSAMEGDKVTAETTHFTVFAVRFVVRDDGKVVQEGGKCEGTFDACGGDIEGTWTIESACAEFDLGDATSQCAGATAEASVDITGDVTFADGKITGTLNITSMNHLVFPKTCFGGMCPAMDDPEDTPWTDAGDNCDAKETNTEEMPLNETYTVDGNTLTTMDPEDMSTDMLTFCVSGDTLVVSQVDPENASEVRWTAKRK